MKIQTFYGEYSLEHWIRLMTEGNILLPEYQRPFKWREDKVIELIESFKEDQFIPPVIIAREGNKNFVLDGQQRLTSLLLVDLKNILNQKIGNMIQKRIMNSMIAINFLISLLIH